MFSSLQLSVRQKWDKFPHCPSDSFRNKIRCQPQSGTQLYLVRAIYPGSFDPLTNGHLDLIERGSKIFDKLIIGILRNSEKDPLFSIPERRTMIEEMTAQYSNVEVDTFGGLLVEYGMRKKATAVLRGIRAIS